MLTDRSPRAALAVLVAFLAVGCGRAPETVPKTAVSWGATAQRVGEAWLAGEVPDAYAARTLRSARERLGAEGHALRSSAPDARAGDLVDGLAALEQAVARLEAALGRHDRGAVDGATRDVAALTRRLGPWARAERAG
jgi:hypothetical protein